MSLPSASVFVLLTSCILTPLRAQARFVPDTRNPPPGKSTQLVAVLISASHCIGNQYPGFLGSVDSMNRSLAGQAAGRMQRFVAVGVTNDWDPDSGMAYLKSLSAFNEVNVGNNWYNMGIAHYVLADSLGQLSVPQVILVERELTADSTTLHFGADRILGRYVGAERIVDWVKKGTPLP